MTQLVDIERHTQEELIDTVEDGLNRQAARSARKQRAEEIANESEWVRHSYGHRLRIGAETTDELKEVQETLEIPESHIREMQQEAGLQLLHPSRREDFITETLSERIDQFAEDEVESNADGIRSKAVDQVETVFDQETQTVEIGFTQLDVGTFSSHVSEGDDPDATVTIENAHTDTSGAEARLGVDLIVPENRTDLYVSSPAGEETISIDRGGYSVSPRSFQTLAEESGLIEREKCDVACQSSDKVALDIVVGRGETDKAHVIELQTGDGGYSKRHTKGWTEYRDFNADREMVLITVGQASYYGGRIRGKSERTWLIGRDDGQIWAQQVYNTHETIDEALDFIIPSEVQRLEEEGREVVRQGDFYFVEMIQASNFEALDGTRHEIEPDEHDESVRVTHPEHDDVKLTGKWKAVENNDGSQTPSRSRVVRD